MLCHSVTIAHRSDPTATHFAAFVSNSLRHTAWFFSSIDSSASTSGLSTVCCRLLAFARKLLISNSFPRSPLNPFFPALAHPSAKSFPCVSYENMGGGGGLVLPIAPEPIGPTIRRSPTSEGGRYKGFLPPTTSHAFLACPWTLVTDRWPTPLPICRLRRCSPLRDTGTSASVASESLTRLR